MDYGWIIGNPSILNNMNVIYKLMVDYRNIKIPDEMIKEIERIFEKNKGLGYRTSSEFVIEAVRKRIEELRSIED